MEMKKNWVKPFAVVQQFMPNEYVAACGDSGVTYKFVCDAGNGARGDVITADGKLLTEDEYDWWSGTITRYYHACGETHEAPGTDDFINGTLILNGGRDGRGGREIPVIIWTDGGRDVHCTTNLDMDSWETARS